MQDASAAFEEAVESPEVTWTGATVLADWLDDGASERAAGQPASVVELFRRDSESTWGQPYDDRAGYTHVGGSSADYTTVDDSQIGKMRFSAVNTSRASYIETASQSMRGYLTWETSADLTGTGEASIDLVLASSGTGSHQYQATMEIDLANDTIDVKLIERFASIDIALETGNDALTYVHGHRYAILAEIDIEGLLFRGKFWDTSIETEPVDWTLEFDMSSPITGIGNWGGARAFMPSGATTTTPFYVHIHELRLIDGSIDDLSEVAGQITISHGMDDGLPSEVTYAPDSGTSVVLNAKILDGQGGMSATKYLSPFNRSSPLYGLARDIAPVTVDKGLVTADGREEVRLFTGRMVDLPIGSDGLGYLQGMSETRLKLSQLVQPPPFNRLGDLSATWPIVWAAHQCGVYAAPPPSGAGIWYAPLAGSLQPFVDFPMPTKTYYSTVFGVLFAGYYRDIGDGELATVTYGDDPESAPAYIDGPYVAAPDLKFTSDEAVGIYYDFPTFAPSSDGSTEGYILSETGPRGRFEFIVRGDTYASTAPSGANYTPATFILGFLQANDGGAGHIRCGINMSRQLRIEMSDGTASINANAAAEFDLPTDGQWYKYGVAWDFVAEAAYFYMQEPDGTEHESTSTNSSLDVTRLPTLDEPFTAQQPFVGTVVDGFLNPYLHSFLPCAELHISGGPNSNPTNATWKWQDEFNAGAVIKRSSIRLRALAEPVEREAWEYIGQFAQAEMAATRVDENDRFMYLTPAYWVESAQQASGQLLDTLTNIGELTPQVDPTKVRNMVRVRYGVARLDNLHAPMFQSRDVIAIPPGESTLLIPLDVLATELDHSAATLPTEAQVNAGIISAFISGGWHTFFTINSQPDGTGTYYSGPADLSTDPVTLQVDDIFTAAYCTVSVVNRTGATVYTANDNPEVPTINIGGIGLYLNEASELATRADSISRRGVRGLAVDAPALQRSTEAVRLAQRLVNELAEPVITLEGVKLFGDPRRQPGDAVSVNDSHELEISGLWRILSVRHVIDGPDYYQTARMRQAAEVGEWQETGTSRWGTALWGREGI